MQYFQIVGTDGLAIPLARALRAAGIQVGFFDVCSADLPVDLRDCIGHLPLVDLTLIASKARLPTQGPQICEAAPTAAGVVPVRFAVPLNQRKLIEVAGQPSHALMGLASHLGLRVVQVAEGYPLPGTRLSAAMLQCLDSALLTGTTVAELDEAWVDAGADCGCFEAMDNYGLERAMSEAGDRSIPVTRQMVREGRLGRSTGVGWYRYPGQNGPVEDPITEDLARTEAWLAKSNDDPKPIAQTLSVIQQCLKTECALIKATGTSPEALRLVCCTGLGLPEAWVSEWIET